MWARACGQTSTRGQLISLVSEASTFQHRSAMSFGLRVVWICFPRGIVSPGFGHPNRRFGMQIHISLFWSGRNLPEVGQSNEYAAHWLWLSALASGDSHNELQMAFDQNSFREFAVGDYHLLHTDTLDMRALTINYWLGDMCPSGNPTNLEVQEICIFSEIMDSGQNDQRNNRFPTDLWM